MPSRRLRFAVPAAASFLSVAFGLSPCLAEWKTGVDYGAATIMDLYVPSSVLESPAVVVSIHYCGGNAASAHGWFQRLADKHGFVIIAPGAGGNCFDATPERSGERADIVKMVDYVIQQNHADAMRVFAAGASSGACMTQALLAAYPEVFAAGSSLAGVPAGAWTGGNAYGWSTPTKTAEQWGDIVRAASPDFAGARPRMQLWHGQGDTILTYSQNWPAEVAQWTNALGVSESDGTASTLQPAGAADEWSRTSFADRAGAIVLETNSSVATTVPHDLASRGLWEDVVRFFGLDQDMGSTGNGTGGGTSSSTGGSSSTSTGGASSATGGSSNAGSGGTAGGGDDGCGCRVAGSRDERSREAVMGLAIAVGAFVRRRRRSLRES